ncbi:MFS transporter [Dyella nitratireducens]|uniref:MFS transporter n=1 Tax=Dyella nitratireducens TaxID=1849580 RepID=A0ABQ1FLX7_9GAMM|nr:MFS transporter [Dyella nitratireducens]GGA21969.1 MFS transporter [Dyella nitratireducens]GLQ44175.1 MFS transporter [Dyella nitratireducens]
MQASTQSTATVALPRWRRQLSVTAVVAAATTFGLTYSLSAPLIAMSLVTRGYSSIFVGVNAAMHALGVLLAAPLLPGLAARFGARRLTVLALVLAGVLLFLFQVWPVVWIWFPLRIMLGAAAEALFVMSETWTNVLSDEHTRGRTMAIYTAALSLGMVLGPALLSQIGVNDRAFTVGAAIAVAAVVFVAPPWVLAPGHSEPERAQPMRYVKLAPIAIATTVLNAGVETAGLSFIALYATGMGWNEDRAMQLISTLMLGAIVLQIPIGWLADKMDRRRLVLILAWISAFTALLWPFALKETQLAFAMVFVWGGLFVGIYTVMLAMVGSSFQGNDLVGVYAVMGLAWGAGALIGPSLAGVAMLASGQLGLPGIIAAACALFAIFVMRSRSST